MATINDPPTESPPPDPVAEELVAYLDGELSPDQCRQVEERLANDADYRERLRELDQAWEALDSLPATKPGDDFARTTIEMVALVAQEEQKQRVADVASAKRKRRWTWAIAGTLAAVGSFGLARMLVPDSNAQLLADLPVLVRMNQLAQVQDIDFLRQLAKDVPLDRLVTDGAARDRELDDFKAASETSPDQRRRWVESLPAEKKADLAAQAEQFRNLQPEERARLKNLEREITAADNADELQQALVAYGQWINRLPEGRKSELRRLSTDERIRRIRDSLRRNDQAARQLSDQDTKALKQELFKIYGDVKDNKEFAKFISRLRSRDITEEEKALFAGSWALWDNNDIDDRTQQRIKARLTSDAQSHLDELKRRGGEGRVKIQLWRWMRDAMLPDRDPANIMRFFATELDEEQRAWLLNQRRDDMEASLEQMYLGSRFGIRGNEWLGVGPGAPRGPGMGRPGWRPEGPPLEGPDANRFDLNRRGPGPEGRRRPFGPPPDRPPPEGQPPPGGPQQEPI